MKNNTLFGIATILVAVSIGYYFLSYLPSRNQANDFQKKQECSGYSDSVETKIKQSGRLFENDTYSVKEIFYSPQMNTCLYAWVIYTTVVPREIYTIEDLFGGVVFTVGLSENAQELFYQEIAKLKK